MENKFNKKEMSMAMQLLMMALMPSAEGVKKEAPGMDPRIMREKTKKGAIHRVGKQFKSRQILSVSPAMYRHLHLGRQKIRGTNGLESSN